eukprot:561233_1
MNYRSHRTQSTKRITVSPSELIEEDLQDLISPLSDNNHITLTEQINARSMGIWFSSYCVLGVHDIMTKHIRCKPLDISLLIHTVLYSTIHPQLMTFIDQINAINDTGIKRRIHRSNLTHRNLSTTNNPSNHHSYVTNPTIYNPPKNLGPTTSTKCPIKPPLSCNQSSSYDTNHPPKLSFNYVICFISHLKP